MADEQDLTKVIQSHFANRPIVPHFLVWTIIGIGLGLLLSPNFLVPTLCAFCIAGAIMAFFLATVTYAVSERYTTTFLGAITGATIPTVGLMSGVELHQQMPAFCLIVGALIGSTCFIWMGALRGLKAIFLKKTGSKVSES